MAQESPFGPSSRTLRRLAGFRSPLGVLSAYLGFPPAGGERRDRRATVYDALAPLERYAPNARLAARVDEEREQAAAFLMEELELHGRSVILFSCAPRGLWEVFQLQVPVRPLVRFAERPLLAPLVAVLDEHERYGVVLVDKDKARIITVYLGQAEHETEIADGYPGRTEMGGWAQARYARHREAHLHRHLLRVAEGVLAEERRRRFDRLIVGGPDEVRSALLAVLPRGLRSRVVGTFAAPLFVSQREIVERVSGIEEGAERQREAELVGLLVEAARGGGPAVIGWDDTLSALGEGRVHKLVLIEPAAQRGRACPAGHFAAVRALRRCPVCGGPVDNVADLGEWAVERAFDTDCAVETVRGQAAQVLQGVGGIGAVLRY